MDGRADIPYLWLDDRTSVRFLVWIGHGEDLNGYPDLLQREDFIQDKGL